MTKILSLVEVGRLKLLCLTEDHTHCWIRFETKFREPRFLVMQNAGTLVNMKRTTLFFF